ncbi:MAG: calcium-binding protein, partial [Gammaproteobacteria bacterium]
MLEFGDPDTGGIDTVYANFSYALGNAEDRLFLGGAGDLSGEGNALDNAISGQAGDNALRGLGGDDTLVGGPGDDSIAGGPGRDSVVGGEGADLFFLDGRGGTNADLVEDFGRGGDADRIGLEADAVGLAAGALDPSRFVAGAGFTAARTAEQRLVYDTSTGRLYLDADGQGGTAPVELAQFGVDTHPLLGAADFLVVDLPRLGGVGARIETIESGENFTLPSRLRDADLKLTGSAVEGGGNDFENGILGNEGGNLLRGYAGRDTLAGGPGDDTLDGGAGNDRLFSGQGADVFALSYPGDADFIGDFSAGEDRFSLNLRVFRGIEGADGGILAPGLFHSAAGAREAPDATVRIVYDSASGALWYDADGASGKPDDLPPLQIAQLGDHAAPALSASDFTLSTAPLA